MDLEGKEVDILGQNEESDDNFITEDSTDIDGFDHLPNDQSDNNNSNIDVDISNNFKHYKDEALYMLSETDLLEDLTQILSDSSQLKDFMDLLEHLRSKSIPCTNIVFVLLLERARFQSCSNTVGMQYSELMKKFWSIVYRLCKDVSLKFFSGEKNWGQVVNKKSRKSWYNPEDSKINFAVPNEKVLRDYNMLLPKLIPHPGKIKQGLNLLSGKKDIIMMADGKLVAKGLKMNFEADINLFGHETNPNLEKLIHEMKSQLDFVAKNYIQFPKVLLMTN